MKKLIFAILFGICVSLTAVNMPAMAEDPVCSSQYATQEAKDAAGCDTSGTIENKVNDIYEVILGVVGIVAVVVIIICGIMLTTSAGDPGKVAKAKKGILYSVVGLLVALLAWAIIKFVLSSMF